MKRMKTGLGYKEILEEGDWVRFDDGARLPIEGCIEAICPYTGEIFIVGKHGQEFFVYDIKELEFVS